MKALKTVISIVFIVGAIAIIVYDAKTQHHNPIKTNAAKSDTSVHLTIKK